jgi:hypothetical protein
VAYRWQPLRPEEVPAILASFPHPWWICGGHAIDAFLSRRTRPHGDLDVGVPRRYQSALYRVLDDFEVHVAHQGTLHELSPAQRETGTLDPDHHGLWCRRRGSEAWQLEVLLGDGDDRDWIFRRCPAVRRPLAEVVWRSSDGIPYLAPEVQLLFKAKHPRDKDRQDFEATAPALSREARRWLRQALERAHPGHEWTQQLAG